MLATNDLITTSTDETEEPAAPPDLTPEAAARMRIETFQGAVPDLERMDLLPALAAHARELIFERAAARVLAAEPPRSPEPFEHPVDGSPIPAPTRDGVWQICQALEQLIGPTEVAAFVADLAALATELDRALEGPAAECRRQLENVEGIAEELHAQMRRWAVEVRRVHEDE